MPRRRRDQQSRHLLSPREASRGPEVSPGSCRECSISHSRDCSPCRTTHAGCCCTQPSGTTAALAAGAATRAARELCRITSGGGSCCSAPGLSCCSASKTESSSSTESPICSCSCSNKLHAFAAELSFAKGGFRASCWRLPLYLLLLRCCCVTRPMLLLLAFLKARQLLEQQQAELGDHRSNKGGRGGVQVSRHEKCLDKADAHCSSNAADKDCCCTWVEGRVCEVLTFSVGYKACHRKKLPEAFLMLLLLRPQTADSPSSEQKTPEPQPQQRQRWTWAADDLLNASRDTFVCRLMQLLVGVLPRDESPLQLVAVCQQRQLQQQEDRETETEGPAPPLLPWWVEAQLLQDSSETSQVEKDVQRSFTAWKFSCDSSDSSDNHSEASDGSFLSMSDGPTDWLLSPSDGVGNGSEEGGGDPRGDSTTAQAGRGSSSSSSSSSSRQSLECLHDSLRLVLLGLLSRHLPTLAYAQGLHDLVAALLLTSADAFRQLCGAVEVYRQLAANGICCDGGADNTGESIPRAEADTPARGCGSRCGICNRSHSNRTRNDHSSSPEAVAVLPCGCLLKWCLQSSKRVGIDAAVSSSSGLSLLCCHCTFLLSERVCVCCVSDYLAAPFEASLLPAVRLLSLLLQQQDPELSTLLRLCSAAAAHTPGGEMLPCVSWLVTWFTHANSPFNRTARLLDSLLSTHPQLVLHVAAAAVRSQRRRLFAVCRAALIECSTALKLQGEPVGNSAVSALCAKLQQRPELIGKYRELVGDAVYGEVHAVLQRVQLGKLSLEGLLKQAHDGLRYEVTPEQLLAVAAAEGLELLPFSPLQLPARALSSQESAAFSGSRGCCCMQLTYPPTFFSFVAPSMPPIASAYRKLGDGGNAAAASASSVPSEKGHDDASAANAAVESWAAAIGGHSAEPPTESAVSAAAVIAAASNEMTPCRCVCNDKASQVATAAALVRGSSCPDLYTHVPVPPERATGWRQPLPSVFRPLEDLSRTHSRGESAWLPIRMLQQLQWSSPGPAAMLRCAITSALALVRPTGFFVPLCAGAVLFVALLFQWLADRPRANLRLFSSGG